MPEWLGVRRALVGLAVHLIEVDAQTMSNTQ
jgi:hypothetical protein